MAEFPALPLFTDAYLGDTTHLTTIEHGAYLMLLMVAWRTRDCCLPDDDAKLAKYARMTRGQWMRIAPTIREFFTARDGALFQSRLTDEYNHVRQVRESQRANGVASALKRKGRHSTTVEPSVSQASTPTPSPTPTKVSDTNVSSPALKPEHVIDFWNKQAPGFGLAKASMTEKRRRTLAQRIRVHDVDDWTEAIAAIGRSPFCLGENDRGWRANIDFLLRPDTIIKLKEGIFDGQRH